MCNWADLTQRCLLAFLDGVCGLAVPRQTLDMADGEVGALFAVFAGVGRAGCE